jgi:hypothetical protein
MKGYPQKYYFTPPHRPVQSHLEQSPNSKPGNKSPVQIQTTPQDGTQPAESGSVTFPPHPALTVPP